MRRKGCWIAAGVIAILLVGGVVGGLIALKCAAPKPPEWLTNPPADNAFDDYVRAAELLEARGLQPRKFLKPGFDPAKRAKFVQANQDVLEILREAAQKECAVADVPPPTQHRCAERLRRLARFAAAAGDRPAGARLSGRPGC